MAEQPKFRRIVLGLSYGRPGHGMRMAADMARLLQLDLFGLFVEEERLFGLAALPFVRELKLIGGGWRPLDINQLTHDLEIAARSAEKAFIETVKTLPTMCRFEVVRGSMAETIASISRAGDIVLVAEPVSPAERASPEFLAISDAALRSEAAVLLVPVRVARQSGAIVAIATEPDDPSIEAAYAIASAAKEDLIVIEAFESVGETRGYEARVPAGIQVRRVAPTRGQLTDAARIASALQHVRERLVVMTRREGSIPSQIASMRHVPILVIETARVRNRSGHNSRTAA